MPCKVNLRASSLGRSPFSCRRQRADPGELARRLKQSFPLFAFARGEGMGAGKLKLCLSTSDQAPVPGKPI